ncbi:MAG: cell wall hydrolase [Halanaerobacter sp.]
MITLVICLFLLFSFSNNTTAAPTFQIDLIYEVKQGDTLYDLAHEFDLKLHKLRRVNDLADDEAIKVGDELIIPNVNSLKEGEGEEERKTSLYESKQERENYQLNYKQQYNIQVKKGSSAQNVDVSNLRTLEYHVRRGDSLYDLAQEFRTSIEVVQKLNDLEETNVIRQGDKIKLPINNLTQKEVISHTMDEQEFELLARLIHGEARGESYIGQVAVGAVILNRVLSSYFPDNLRSVVHQPGQFSPVANGQINLHPNRTAYRAAKAALQGKDPTRGACYFYNPRTAENRLWFKSREVVVEIGNHVFAK